MGSRREKGFWVGAGAPWVEPRENGRSIAGSQVMLHRTNRMSMTRGASLGVRQSMMLSNKVVYLYSVIP